MRLRSLGLATDLALWQARGAVVDRGDYLVVSTPSDPGYYYGNLLVLPAAPQVGEVAHWSRRFADELGRLPGVHHVSFAWDSVTGDVGAVDELRAAGFEVETSEVLTAATLPPVPPADGVAPRPLSPDEVLQTYTLAWQIADRHDESYLTFLRRRAAWQRDLVLSGAARFWGVFEDDALVASLGLVRLGGRARFQDVQTAASHRQRGLASALLAAAAAAAQGDGVTQLVIVADPGGAAARLYLRLGFASVERYAWACLKPAAG
jgi:GNAT superfamily N-acetyltransferase